jgi:hypothetical protein
MVLGVPGPDNGLLWWNAVEDLATAQGLEIVPAQVTWIQSKTVENHDS